VPRAIGAGDREAAAAQQVTASPGVDARPVRAGNSRGVSGVAAVRPVNVPVDLGGAADTASTQLPATVLAVRGERIDRRPDQLVGEEPLEIRVRGLDQERVDVAVTMRTPGGEEELAVGFLVTEGLIDAEWVTGFAWGEASRMARPDNEITVQLDRTFDVAAVPDRAFVATASCGICGKASIDDVAMRCEMLPSGPRLARSVLLSLPDTMRAAQRVFASTGGLHAAGLFTPRGELVALREDIGRHNALDKVIGAAARAGELPLHDRVLLVSGRVSFEITQKAAMAGVPILAAVSAPSDLAVATAARLNMTLIGFLRGDGFNVYTGEERIDLDA
jgi:FdhD protein